MTEINTKNISCNHVDKYISNAANLYDNCKYELAVTALTQHLQIHNDCFEAIFNIGAAYEAMGNLEQAASYFLKAAQLHPGHLPSWQRGLQAFAKSGQTDLFADHLVRFITACREHGLFWKWPYYMLQYACEHHMNRGDKATTFAFFNAVIGRSQQYERLHMGWFVFLFGGYFLRVGDLANATNCVRFATKEVPFLIHACFGNEFAERVESVPATFEQFFDASIRFSDLSPETADHGCVILCACDAKYFKRFSHLMALSVDIFSVSPRIIHFHIIDADAECADLLNRIRATLKKSQVQFSSQPDYQELPWDDRLTYFTCSRFMIAAAIMERYKIPVLIADVDGVFIDDPVLFTKQLSPDAPLALLYGPDRLDALYNGIGAGLVVLYPTPQVSELVHRVKRYMLYWYERRKLVWFFDQLTWVCAVDEAKQRKTLPQIHRLTMDRGRIKLGTANFYQVFDQKREEGFDAKVSAFVDEISQMWQASEIAPPSAKERYCAFFRIEDLLNNKY